MSRALFAWLLVAWLLVRGALALLPGYAVDVDQIKSWALGAAVHGPTTAYQTTTLDYPPLFLFLIHPMGEIYLALHPELASAEVRRGERDVLLFRTADGATYRHPRPLRPRAAAAAGIAPLPGDALLGVLVKLPALLCDLAIAALLYLLVAVRGTWGRSRAGPRSGYLAASCWLWNPAVLWASGYWAAPDAIHSALALGAFALLGAGRWAPAGAALAAGGLMKPLAAPLVPLLAWVSGARGGLRGFVRAGAAGLAVAVLLFVPFFAAGVGPEALSQVLLDVDAMPFTSVNAHNLWWFVGGWQDATAPQLLGVSARSIGLALFLLAYAGLLAGNRGWLGAEPGEAVFTSRLLLLAAAASASFFLLSTHMHENHLFTALPFLVALAGRGRPFFHIAVGLSGVMLANLVLHDPSLDMPWRQGADLSSAHGLASYLNASAALVGIGWLYWNGLTAERAIPAQASSASVAKPSTRITE